MALCNWIKGVSCDKVTLCNVHVYKWENAYIRDLNAWEILKNFYLFIKVKVGGGCTSSCICIGTQSQP